jgi:hypothetical protein
MVKKSGSWEATTNFQKFAEIIQESQKFKKISRVLEISGVFRSLM